MKIHWKLINKYIEKSSSECACKCPYAIEDDNNQCCIYVSCGPRICDNPCKRCLCWTGYGQEDREDMK